jgi:hypothetical protein
VVRKTRLTLNQNTTGVKAEMQKKEVQQPCFGSERGKAFFDFIFTVYGIMLICMLASAVFMNLLTDDWVRPVLNTLQDIIPLAYLIAVVFYFLRLRVYIFLLIAAYAYDSLFHFYAAGMLFTDYPVWAACALFTLVFGLLYKGFKFRWWFRREKKGHRNDYIG